MGLGFRNSSIMSLTLHLAMVSLALLSSAAVAEAASLHQAPCVAEWSGPSAENNFDDCTDPKLIQDWLITKVALVGFPLVVGLLMFFACPFVFCARYCCQCCGGYTRRPGNCCCGESKYDDMPEDEVRMNYSRADVSCAKYAPLGLLILAIIFVSLTFSGSVKLVAGINNIGVGILDGVQLVYRVVTSFAEGTLRTDGTYLVSTANFTEVLDQVDQVYEDFQKEEYQQWIRLAKEVADALAYCAVLPAILIVISVALAFLHVRTCVPCFLNMFFFTFAFVYGLAGTIFLTAHLPVDVVCGEVFAQLDREPSVLQWYVVPQCEKENILSSLVEEVDRLELTAAEEACKGIKEICNDASQPASATYQFSCDLSLGTNCTTFDNVDAFAKSMSLKDTSPETCGTNPSGRSGCDLCACGTYCVDTTVKDSAKEACRAIQDANNVLVSFRTNVASWLDCNTLLDALVTILRPVCEEVPQGFYLLGIGCTFVVFTMLPALIVVFRGQKRWFVMPNHITFESKHDMDQPLVASHSGGGVNHTHPEGEESTVMMMQPPPQKKLNDDSDVL